MLRFKTKVLHLDSPIIMGILNLTPDSFFDGGQYTQSEQAIQHTQELLNEGAAIIDIGAYSTRPGAPFVSEEEELERLQAILPQLCQHFPETVFSIDTFRSNVARYAISQGVTIVNDVSGGTMDPNMYPTVVEHQVYYILMHMRGTLADMQNHTNYQQVAKEVVDELEERLGYFKQVGYDKIILDPGFGFSKTLDQNFELLANLNEFQRLPYPLLVGISRKSMIWKTLDLQAKDALNGTTVLNTHSLLHGAKILRVHDVKEAKEAILLTQKLLK